MKGAMHYLCLLELCEELHTNLDCLEVQGDVFILKTILNKYKAILQEGIVKEIIV